MMFPCRGCSLYATLEAGRENMWKGKEGKEGGGRREGGVKGGKGDGSGGGERMSHAVSLAVDSAIWSTWGQFFALGSHRQAASISFGSCVACPPRKRELTGFSLHFIVLSCRFLVVVDIIIMAVIGILSCGNRRRRKRMVRITVVVMMIVIM